MRVALAGLAALAVAMGIGRFAFTPILPMMQQDLGLSIAAGGWLASANYVGYLAGALWVGATRVDAARAIRAGLIAIGLATLAMGLTAEFAAWAVLRAIAGVASAWVLIHTASWCLERLAPLGRPLLSGVLFAGVGTGIVVAGAMCMLLMAMHAGSASAWLVLGVLSVAITILVWPVFARSGDALPADAAAGGWSWAQARLVLAYGGYGFGYIIPATFLPVMARQVVADPAVFGWAWPVFGAAAAASTLAVSVLSERYGSRAAWIGSQLAMAVGVAAPVVWPGIAGIVLSALCVGGTFVVITMVGIQEARIVAGARAPGLIAAMTAAFAAGQIVGPLCVSLIMSAGGGFSAALLIACAVLVAGAALLLVRPARRRTSPAG